MKLKEKRKKEKNPFIYFILKPINCLLVNKANIYTNNSNHRSCNKIIEPGHSN